MSAFQDAYRNLNAAQREAVDTIDGPLLVIAGPGTGKTQLLSARVAAIIDRTDTPASNILCLTFTESGASNMRQRLSRFIGQSAYDVTISTYHAFGGDLIKRYPQYFGASRLQKPVDELGKRQVLLSLIEAMSYKNPLKQTRHHPGDLASTISELKRALLTPVLLRTIAASNLSFIQHGSGIVQEVFATVTKMPGTYAKALPYFEATFEALTHLAPDGSTITNVQPLSIVCTDQLRLALKLAGETNKSTHLTNWKNDWLAKNSENHYIIAGELENQRITALADVLENYSQALETRGLYDFDDMIIRSITALEQHADFRYTLQERYLYIMLDEFQDTNAAQLRIVQLLSNNPVSEGRPNIMAVGDDDQAIYAFQGAEYSNMIEFYGMYRDTKLINLVENYRSHADILTAAHNIAGQIESRLTNHFSATTKSLQAANDAMQHDILLERREFQSEIAERGWIAGRIGDLIAQGISPSEIAVLSPKHRQLESLVPFLNADGIPVRYEKRENILEAAVVRQLINMSRLLLALQSNNWQQASSLWPEVLSYDFWHIPTSEIWQLSWSVNDGRGTNDNQKLSWSQAVLASSNLGIQLAGKVLLSAATQLSTESFETIIDYLIGSAAVETHAGPGVFSPLREYYLSARVQQSQPELFYETMSHLTVLRSRLRDYQDTVDNELSLTDFIHFVDMYAEADQPMIDTSPYSQQADAVQLMTVFKAKGLEFRYVFLPQCLDDVWGASSRGNSNKLTLPANLQPIRHAGTTDDERLRILFVAITRAQQGLILTSGVRSYSGKPTKRLKYFDEQEQVDGSYAAMVLPPKSAVVKPIDIEVPLVSQIELNWRTKHLASLKDVTLINLLSDRLDNYQLSPTHLVSFVDVEYAGPEKFFFDTILRFPTAPSIDGQFGTALHETLEWYQHQVSEHGFCPQISEAVQEFTNRLRGRKYAEQRQIVELERGKHALEAYLGARAQIYQPDDIAEKNFRSESVFYGDIHMTGKVDRLEIRQNNRTITIVDYKSGKAYSSWRNDLKLHKYRLQLYAYKLLLEGSQTYRGYTVTSGRLEFIEPDNEGHIYNLSLDFTEPELERVKQLMAAVWKHAIQLNFPDITQYPQTLVGMLQFEQDLIDDII